ncbi:ion channel [Catalinimonas alkaloidigena]|uniref:ion channel n=1 Tax=Catalinimonas alkaloidigena TaxID=1075417 RepID=UPI00240531D5|nr:ion channel [Catalinimonas alkaloidigena]
MNDSFKDLGLGNSSFEYGQRLINKNGSFNVKKKGRPWLRPYDAYNALISMSWIRFLCLVSASYFVVNLIFAFIYVAVGIDQLSVSEGAFMGNLYEAFFFSSQTITTVGYGRVNPVSFWAGVVSSVESLLGLMGFALITGLIYGRFSRPHARILYSENAIIAPYRDINAFMFRIANKRSSELIEVQVKVVYTYFDHQQKKRVYENLKLERNKVDFLAMSWTIVHPLDEDSPLFKVTKETFEQQNGEFLVLIKGFDDSFSQEVYARSSYKNDEIVWGRKFKMAYGSHKKGMVALWMNLIHDSEEVPLN